jgi:hypothetical protein
MPMLALRNALRDFARRSVVPFGLAALVIAGLLGMHAASGMPGMSSVTLVASGSTAAADASSHDSAPASASAHGCHGCSGTSGGDEAGAMAVCGMVLLSAIGLGVASGPGILPLVAPALLHRAGRTLRSLGEPRPSLWALSISRT